MELQSVKLRFGIIGNSPKLERAMNIALQVAPTDLAVLITGESGVGKERFPQIIHQYSARKHGSYIAVNCGAIPEGTIDSELFGHEKGSFTGASEARKGYFEVVNGGTIFLDEVAEMPLSTQARLLRVLETGEFIRVGSSKPQKTNVRVVAATNVNLQEAIANGKFREDLYYRLNTVPIEVPPLRDRKEDILLLFRKFSVDFADKFKIPPIHLDPEAENILKSYRWPGNVRQLKNITEQISIIESERLIDAKILFQFLPADAGKSDLPILFRGLKPSASESFERELIYGFLGDLKHDVAELKHLVAEIITSGGAVNLDNKHKGAILNKLIKIDDDPIRGVESLRKEEDESYDTNEFEETIDDYPYEEASTINTDDSLSIEKKERDLILKALNKHNGKRKYAAIDLGISERTLYRKIKEYNIE
jgi:transcriptional regulator with PAS, ATPase and Fis domain